MMETFALRAAEAFAAVQALVAITVAHSDMPAVGTQRGVYLEVGDGVAKGCDRPSVD